MFLPCTSPVTPFAIHAFRCLIAKALNQFNYSFTQGAANVNRMLRGAPDSRFSHLTAIHDAALFTLPTAAGRERSSGGKVLQRTGRLSADSDTVYTFTDLQSNRARAPDLTRFSPVEMTMAFEAARPASTVAARALLLQGDQVMAGRWGHNPRRRLHLPQLPQ